MIKYLGLAGLALVVLGLAWIRLAPDDVALWHVDPQTVRRGEDPNRYLMRAVGGDAQSPTFGISAQELAQTFDALVLSRPRVSRLAGGPDELWTTYIQRSKLFGFPDYISVRAIAIDEGHSRLAIFSRSRYGRGDMGVNKARVQNWVAALRDILKERGDVAAE